MATYTNEYIETVKRNLGDPINISEELYEQAVQQAVRIYSRYKPRVAVSDIAGTTVSGDFDLALPAAFQDGFSSIKSVEYPYDSTSPTPAYLKEGLDYRVYRNTTSVVLRFFNNRVTNTQVARVEYTAPHTVTDTSTTIPAYHEDAVSNQASSLIADMIAADYANHVRSSMDEIAIDFQIKANEWQTISDRFQMLFRKDLGLGKDGENTPAVAWTDLDFGLSPGVDYLTHPRRWR